MCWQSKFPRWYYKYYHWPRFHGLFGGQGNIKLINHIRVTKGYQSICCWFIAIDFERYIYIVNHSTDWYVKKDDLSQTKYLPPVAYRCITHILYFDSFYLLYKRSLWKNCWAILLTCSPCGFFLESDSAIYLINRSSGNMDDVWRVDNLIQVSPSNPLDE